MKHILQMTPTKYDDHGACIFTPPWDEHEQPVLHGQCVGTVKSITKARFEVLAIGKYGRHTYFKVRILESYDSGSKIGWLPSWHVSTMVTVKRK